MLTDVERAESTAPPASGEGPVTLGSLEQPRWAVALGLVTTALSTVWFWQQWGPAVGAPFLALGLWGSLGLLRRGGPAYTIEREALVWHLGPGKRRLPWTELGRARLVKKHWQHFLQINRPEKRPLLLPVDAMTEDERKVLCEIVKQQARRR